MAAGMTKNVYTLISMTKNSITKLPITTLLTATATTLLLLLALPAAADLDQDDVIRLKQAGEILPLESILKTARQQHDGKVIGVELEREHKTLIYEIKILDDHGELWEIKIDAKDGRVLQQEEDD